VDLSRESVQKTYIGDDGVRWTSVASTITAALVLWYSELVTTMLDMIAALPSTIPRMFWGGASDVVATVLGYAGSSWQAAWAESASSLPALGPLSYVASTAVVAVSLVVAMMIIDWIREVAALE